MKMPSFFGLAQSEMAGFLGGGFGCEDLGNGQDAECEELRLMQASAPPACSFICR